MPPYFAIRCDVVAKCLPESEFKNKVCELHAEMLAEIDALKQRIEREYVTDITFKDFQ